MNLIKTQTKSQTTYYVQKSFSFQRVLSHSDVTSPASSSGCRRGGGFRLAYFSFQ